jgi:hypothetical protein
MRQIKAAIAGILALSAVASASAQTFPTVPSQTVIGRTAIGTGPAQAIPFASLLASMLTSPLTVSQVNVNSIVFAGATSGSATVSAQSVAGTTVIKWPTVSGTVVTSATLPLVENATTGAMTCPNCAISISTRTAAAAQDLSSYSFVRTTGYSTAGDGGEAYFQKIAGGTAFLDSFISTGSVTGNGTSTCTNGTYLGQVPNSPNTQGFQTAFTITVAGNVVTAMTNTAPGNGYAAGTVLQFTVTGCSATVTWTIATVTTPSGSFTDSAGNKWQIILPAAGLDARAMGVKFDWTVAGGDAAATDNFTTLQNAINFAAYAPGFIDTGSSNGGLVRLPRGTALFCGAGTLPLKVWNGVTVQGQGATASVIKPCDTYSSNVGFIELCDTASHVACFSAAIRDLQLFTTHTVGQGSAAAVTQSAVYTNSCQHQGCGIYNATIYPGACRQGVKAEFGYGGAAMVFLINDVEIKGGHKDANCAAGAPAAVSISGYVSTLIRIDGLNIGGISAASGFGPRSNGIAVSGGFVMIDKLYAESVVAPVIVNITGATNGFVHVKGFDSGVACVNGVLRAGGSTANTVKLESAFANTCTNTYNNAGAASGAIVQLAAVVF